MIDRSDATAASNTPSPAPESSTAREPALVHFDAARDSYTSKAECIDSELGAPSEPRRTLSNCTHNKKTEQSERPLISIASTRSANARKRLTRMIRAPLFPLAAIFSAILQTTLA